MIGPNDRDLGIETHVPNVPDDDPLGPLPITWSGLTFTEYVRRILAERESLCEALRDAEIVAHSPVDNDYGLGYNKALSDLVDGARIRLRAIRDGAA